MLQAVITSTGTPGGCISRVVQVDEDQIKPPRLERFEDRRRLGDYFRLVAARLEEQLESIENVALVVGQENPSRRCVVRSCDEGHFQRLHVCSELHMPGHTAGWG